MDDIAYLVSIQPILVSWIMIFVTAILFMVILDFLCSLIFPGWFSPCGWKTRKKGSHSKNETK